MSASAVAGFLLFDREFPRSVHHCVTGAQTSLHTVTGTPARSFANRAERALGRLVAELDHTDADEVIASGLHEFLDALQVRLNVVGNQITRTFTRHLGDFRQWRSTDDYEKALGLLLRELADSSRGEGPS